jgi:hypothetical protein
VNNNYLDLGTNKSGFVHTLPSGRLKNHHHGLSTGFRLREASSASRLIEPAAVARDGGWAVRAGGCWGQMTFGSLVHVRSG